MKKSIVKIWRCAPVIAASVSLVTLMSCGVNQVVPASPSFEGRGASYYLPRTVVVVTVPVSKNAIEPGEFKDYSLPLLGIEPETAPTSFGLGEEITLGLEGQKDPAQRFIAIDPRGPFKTFTRTMTFNEQGVLAKGEASVEDKTVEFAVSTIEAAAKLAGSATKALGGKTELFPMGPGLEELCEHVNGLDKKKDHALTVDGLRAGLDILLSENRENELTQLENQTALKPAADNWKDFAANCPKGVSEMNRAIITYKELKVLVTKIKDAWPATDRAVLQNERDNKLAKFIGKKLEKKTWVGQFRWDLPSRGSEITGNIELTQPLFDLSEHGGIGWPANKVKLRPEVPPSPPLTGKPLADDKNFSVSIRCESIVPEQTAVWQTLVLDRKKHGWYYRIPAEAKVSVMVNDVVRMTRRCFIAQHGCVAFVPATSASQKIVSNIELDPITGALKSTVHGGQAFDPALVTRTGTAAASVIDVERAREKAEATANDPVTRLERKKKLLQLRKDISALEASE